MDHFRFFLAVTVVHGHLLAMGVYWQQAIAVFGFYLLSGYLITRIRVEVYNHPISGLPLFLFNRFLRIYPTYYVCCFIAFLLIIYSPDLTSAAYGVRIPRTDQGWMEQISIIGLTTFFELTHGMGLLPTAWSLGVEVFYYLVIGCISARSIKITWGLFIACLIGTTYWYSTGGDHMYLYKTISGPGIVFFTGSLLYHHRQSLIRFASNNGKCIWIVLLIVLFAPDITGLYELDQYKQPYLHFSIFIMSWIILSFIRIDHESHRTQASVWGDLSYPVFLIHLPVADFVRRTIGITHTQGYDVFFYSMIPIILIGIMVVLFEKKIIDITRNKVRCAAKKQSS